jgi:hypothetical protein
LYLAPGVLHDDTRDVLGRWIEQTEGAKFWLKVFNDLRTRGVNDILIAVVDGLKALPTNSTIQSHSRWVLAPKLVATCVVGGVRRSCGTVLRPDLHRRTDRPESFLGTSPAGLAFALTSSRPLSALGQPRRPL